MTIDLDALREALERECWGAFYGGGFGGAGYARGPKRVQEQMYGQRTYDPAEFGELSPEQLEWLNRGGGEDER